VNDASATVHSTEDPGKSEAEPRPARGHRTCVGCGQTDAPKRLVRLVIAPSGEVAVDLAGGQFGRGAHVHASPRCVATAPRGLSKTFHQSVGVTAQELAQSIVAAADRRIAGLLASAARSRNLEIGAVQAGQAFEDGKAYLLVVARDAAAAASVGRIMHAVANGGAVAWGTKILLGSLAGKLEVAVLGITSQPLAAALRSAVSMSNGVVAEDR
jgi:predicted RNA-binding protein YlxR (DUF448 family)